MVGSRSKKVSFPVCRPWHVTNWKLCVSSALCFPQEFLSSFPWKLMRELEWQWPRSGAVAEWQCHLQFFHWFAWWFLYRQLKWPSKSILAPIATGELSELPLCIVNVFIITVWFLSQLRGPVGWASHSCWVGNVIDLPQVKIALNLWQLRWWH